MQYNHPTKQAQRTTWGQLQWEREDNLGRILVDPEIPAGRPLEVLTTGLGSLIKPTAMPAARRTQEGKMIS
jgi:hypothetical protein